MIQKFLVLVILLPAVSLKAQEKPSAPKPACTAWPKSDVEHIWHDRTARSLFLVHSASAVVDGITTREAENLCKANSGTVWASQNCIENDLLSRSFIGRHPTWPRMVAFGTVEVIGGMWLSERMSRSENRWVRRLQWAPQCVLIGSHIVGTAHNVWLIRQPTSCSTSFNGTCARYGP